MTASCYPWIFFATLLLVPTGAIADDYLDALQNEASELEYLDESRPSNVGHVTKQSNNENTIKAAQSITQFEQYYKQQDAASAAIYLRLDKPEQLRIYRRFKSTLNLEIAKKMTFDLDQKK